MRRDRNRIPYWVEFIFWMAGNMFIAIMFPILNNKEKWLDETQVILFTVMITTGLISAEVFFTLKKLSDAEDVKHVLWDTLHRFDNRLSIIRKCFHGITESREIEPDLFQKYFEHEAEHFQEVIYGTSTRQELMIDQRHFSNTTIALDCFRGERSDIFRAVHLFHDNEFFLTSYPRQYSKQIAEKVRGGKIRRVKRLMIYREENELKLDSSLRIIKSHEMKTNFIYKIISYTDYAKFLKSEQLQNFPDFGVYGNKYLYRALVSEPDEIRGIWTKDKEVIGQFVTLFDDCFNSIFAHTAKDLGIDLSNVVASDI